MSPQPTKSLFLIGIGYIGGSVLTRLLSTRPDLSISALTRSDAQAAQLTALGVKPIRGSLQDTKVIEEQAALHDIVLNISSSDDVPSVQAIVSGLRARENMSQRRAIFIQTSGTGVLTDNSKSEYAADSNTYTFHDGDPASLEKSIPDNALHRDVDLVIRDQLARPALEKEHNVSVAIMTPPTIYGQGSGPFNRTSIQAPAFIRAAFAAKQGLTVGKGKAVWDAVHIDDLVDAYMLLLAYLEKTHPATEDGYYWFAGTHVFSWGDLARSVGKALFKLGKASTPDVREATSEELNKYFWSEEMAFVGFGSNSLSSAERLAKLGWKKRSDTPTILESVEQIEVKAMLDSQA